MPAPHKLILCLLPLLAAGCAAAGPPATRIGDAAAPEVRFARVSSRSVSVQLAQPAHAAILEVRPGPYAVARWLEEPAIQHLPSGAHTVALAPQNQRPVRGSPCDRAGERTFYDLEAAQTAASASGIRRVYHGGVEVFCVRTPVSAGGERNVLVVVSPQPVEYGRLEELISAFNSRYAGLSLDADALSRTLAEMLASAWAGSAGYTVRVPG